MSGCKAWGPILSVLSPWPLKAKISWNLQKSFKCRRMRYRFTLRSARSISSNARFCEVARGRAHPLEVCWLSVCLRGPSVHTEKCLMNVDSREETSERQQKPSSRQLGLAKDLTRNEMILHLTSFNTHSTACHRNAIAFFFAGKSSKLHAPTRTVHTVLVPIVTELPSRPLFCMKPGLPTSSHCILACQPPLCSTSAHHMEM